MKNILRSLFAMLVVLGLAWSVPAVAQIEVYVATNGSDTTGTGSSGSPFASLAMAQSSIETSCGARRQSATINIGAGTYYLLYSQTNPGTLVFTCKDSGTSTYGVTWQPTTANTSVIVSGAVQVGGTSGVSGLGLTWTLTRNYTNVYQVTLPSTFTNTNASPSYTYNLQPFEYLYYLPAGSTTPTRRLRARIEQSDGVGYYMSSGTCESSQGSAPGNNAPCNFGTYLRVYNPVAYNSATNTPDCPNDGVKCLDRFQYSAGNATGSTSLPDPITDWTNLNGTYNTDVTSGTGFSGPCSASSGSRGLYPEGDIGLTLIDAWTVDAMRIACIDFTGDIIYLTGATKPNTGQTNYFGPNTGHRYYIENVRDAFWKAQSEGQTGLWYWDRSTSVLYYIINPGENLTTGTVDTVLIPQLPYSSVVASGQQLCNQFPQTTSGLVVCPPTGSATGNFVGGSLLWAKAPTGSASGLSYVNFDGITFQMDDFVPSFTGFNNDDNGDIAVPQAIDCESCQNVVFNGVTVAYTSGSGLLIASPPGNTTTTAAATADTIENSSFLDIGDSGIRLGHLVNGNDSSTSVVNDILVNQNLVDGYSRIFADGEGIAQGNGQGNTISYNDVTDGYHAAISVCQESCGPFSGGVGINGSNMTAEYNRLWNLNQGVTSDGGSLYFNVGGQSGSGTGNTIQYNLIHDNTDSQIIDGYGVIAGTGYGGDGVYLDSQTGGVQVKYNVVYHMSDFAVSLSEGPTVSYASNPNVFENNIFSLAIQGMVFEGIPWNYGCSSTSPFTTVEFLWNIWNFDQTEDTPSSSGATPGFSFLQGCANSCGQSYYQFQDFEANAYNRASTSPNFCNDPYAFHVLSSPASGGSCSTGNYNTTNSNFMYFDSAPLSKSWQKGTTPVTIDEDDGKGPNTTDIGLCWNPNFGTSGSPGDYDISSNPTNTPFSYSYTHNTIHYAGRTGQPNPATIPETLPTYSYTNSQF
jgi:hypothetical protein